LGAWWTGENGGLPLPLGANVIHKRLPPQTRSTIARILAASIQFGLDHRAQAVEHALQYARDMGGDMADRFVGMYVNHWTVDYGEKGRSAIRLFLGRAHQRGLLPNEPQLEFVAT
jgi:1,4-dihydroxy-6-naphthoate synthase